MNPSPVDPGRVAIRQRELAYAEHDHLEVFAALPRAGPRWLLDSAHRHERLGRYSFAGSDPYAVLKALGARIELVRRRTLPAGPLPSSDPGGGSGDPLNLLRALVPSVARDRIDWPADLPTALPFVGGAVGCLGYALGALTEDLVLEAKDDLEVPDLTALLVDRLLAWDHVERRAWAIGLGFGGDADEARAHADMAADAQRDAFDRVVADRRLRHAPTARATSPDALRDRRAVLATAVPEGTGRGLGRADYLERVVALREQIERGNVYEVNLTRRLSLPFDGDPWRLYRALRAQNPAPFACYLELDDGVVLGSSPECFLRVDSDGRVESRPIKGTRPRGATPACDAALEKELASSEKDRAENLMIVDLVRNDLGRVCEIGSVEVPELMRVEAYASVFQLVSAVTGRLAPGRDRIDLIRAAFPPGSMTGAPKRAAMKLIDRMESSQRGLYSGAIGYLDVRGGMDLSVVIRTMLVRRGEVHLDVGGAIVADSVPAAEYDETIDKARALLAALAALEDEGA